MLQFPPSARPRLLAALLLLPLAACVSYEVPPEPAPRPPVAGGHRIATWPLDELAAGESNVAFLQTDNGPVGLLPVRHLRAALEASRRLFAANPGDTPEMLVCEGHHPNAYALDAENQPKIALNYAMFRMLGDDEAAWAALIGHELAHIRLRHKQVRDERRELGATTSELLGIALSIAGIPLATAVSDGATGLMRLGYGRDDEREADRRGVEFMIAAGYDPEGAVRLQEKLARSSGGETLSFLSTHPQGSERVEAMRALVRELRARPAPAAK